MAFSKEGSIITCTRHVRLGENHENLEAVVHKFGANMLGKQASGEGDEEVWSRL